MSQVITTERLRKRLGWERIWLQVELREPGMRPSLAYVACPVVEGSKTRTGTNGTWVSWSELWVSSRT